MTDVNDSGDGLWGRPDDSDFTYVVKVPGTNEEVSLTAVQDREICAGTPAFPSHGHCVWDAALLLADYLQTEAGEDGQATCKFQFKGKKVVELGAGVGLVGMALAVLGAEVVVTDQEYALPLLAKNVDTCSRLASWKKSVDVVVFSDVLYHASAFLLLIETLHELVSPTSDVFFSFETRNESIEANFLQQLGNTFDVEEYPDELFIYHARLKAGSNDK
ncbi:hypothetical protein PHYSODRAFT_309503 [Phytophthora sojae]|uniref:Uncharacterized protein n=1 Tax=Phytophthora sojae (strain P6497) TaxID=1094619 RepID=G4YHF7_PHYSP|nr:hypothetical protein PHYSODRAFT_309503 [Phytophthora sojae]EGZ28745.1 hypothetical protein PHYSODRAFT_309503 [Phytophthora sojae]|eukprot:XP_009516020.1 hypothetical protein PHYSODRAFT_309503 [Phytophthora sojae]